MKYWQKDFNKLANSFGMAVQCLNTTGDMSTAKTLIKNEMKRMLEFGNEVFGPDELTVIARPYINISSGASDSLP